MTPPETDAPSTDPKLAKALDAALTKIRSDFGEDAVMDMSGPPRAIESTPTGALPLDIALGIGGVPKGRIIEIFGPESSGKTTLCYHLIAEVQRRGEVAAFIDTEHAMDAVYAKNLGVNLDDLVVSQPDYGEQALQICQLLTDSGAVRMIMIDSVAALTPKSELEGNMGDSSVGQLARMMSQAMRKLASTANKNGTTIVFTNQIREKIGVMFGSPETQPGGRALKFAASQRLDIRRIETVKDGGEAVANRVRVKVVKNKVAPPFKQAEFEIVYGQGIDRNGSLLDFCLDKDAPEELSGLVKKSGSFYSWVPTDEKMGQGAAKAKAWLSEHPAEADQIEAAVRAAYLSKDADAAEEDAEVEAGAEEALAEVVEA